MSTSTPKQTAGDRRARDTPRSSSPADAPSTSSTEPCTASTDQPRSTPTAPWPGGNTADDIPRRRAGRGVRDAIAYEWYLRGRMLDVDTCGLLDDL